MTATISTRHIMPLNASDVMEQLYILSRTAGGILRCAATFETIFSNIDIKGNNDLHRTAENGAFAKKYIPALGSLPPQALMYVLLITNAEGLTPLHVAAMNGHAAGFHTLFENLTNDQILSLLNAPCICQTTPVMRGAERDSSLTQFDTMRRRLGEITWAQDVMTAMDMTGNTVANYLTPQTSGAYEVTPSPQKSQPSSSPQRGGGLINILRFLGFSL